MVKKMFVGIMLLFALQANAQQYDFIKGGLIRANLTFTQSFMLQHKNKNVYLGGHLELFTSKNFSIRGDCFWYMDTRQQNPILKQNAIVLFGAVMHLPKGRNDFYLGIQPGFSLTRPQKPDFDENNYNVRLMPDISLLAGYTLYFSKFCHFYIGLNYLVSRYRGTTNGSLKLDELFISGGLGFHLNLKKQKPEH